MKENIYNFLKDFSKNFWSGWPINNSPVIKENHANNYISE